MTIGAVIWPDEEAKRACNEVRTQYDPHVLLIDPHITVIFPFETDVPITSLVEKLARSVVGLSAFHVLLGKLSTIHEQARTNPDATKLLSGYANARNAIFLIPEEGYGEILRLKRLINTAIGRVTSLVEYPPYLTLGQTLSDANYARALARLAGYHPSLRFAAECFDLVREAESGHWEAVHRFMFLG